MPALIASIDIGTTSTRAILFHKDGLEFAKHQIEYRTSANSTALDKNLPVFSDEGIAITETENLEFESHRDNPITLSFPNPGWVECNPINILSNCLICLAACLVKLSKTNKVLAAKGEPVYEIRAIGIANMRETTILWSKKTGLPVYNGIVWNDTRTSEIVERLAKTHSRAEIERMRHTLGLPPATYFSASKILWMLENVPEAKHLYDNPTHDDGLMFGTVDTWLVYNLTREQRHVTDITNALRTCLMSLDRRSYDPWLFDFWGIDKSRIAFPEICSSSEFFGTFKIPNLRKYGFYTRLTEEAFTDLKNHLKGVPITGILGDQLSLMVGQLVLQQGLAKCTYGTGAFLLYNTGTKKMVLRHGTLTTYAYWFKCLEQESELLPCFALEGSIAVAGSIVSYLRDNLKFIDKAQDVGPLATQVTDLCGVVFVPAFSGLYSPYWIQTRGNIFGLTQFTNASHIARAAIEGVCFQVKAILQAMAEDSRDSMIEEVGDMEGGGIDEKLRDMSLNGDEENLPLRGLSVDGGMLNSDEVMQIQADILGPKVTISKALSAECTAFGAAIAAGFGFEDDEDRVWSGFNELYEAVNGSLGGKKAEKFHCEEDRDKRIRKWRMWERAVERLKGWLDPL